MKRLLNSITIVICLMLFASCEIDNYDEPDATIQGVFYDHNGRPLQLNHGSEYIRMREISWAKDDPNKFTANRKLKVQLDGTYRNTKQFAGDYRMFPVEGNFFPYYDANDPNKDGDNAGELVRISGVTNQDFTVTPYLTIEWIETPMATPDNFIECAVRFKRNQKAGFEMPDLREARMQVSRTINPSGGNDGDLFPTPMVLTNDMEGKVIRFKTARAVKWTGIDYWIRITMNCQTAAGKPETNYPGMGQVNCTTIEKIFVP